MSEDGPNVRPEDALQVAQRALSKVNDLEEEVGHLQDEYDDLAEDLTALELRLSEIDDERPYESLSLNEKIGKVREHAFQRAVNGHGKATLDYNDVMWSVFDGEPGSDHCYKLMRLAAGVDEDGDEVQDVPGFKFLESERPMKLAVDAERAKQGVAFSPENKTTSEGVN
ncbi:hypothetical protein [Halopiger thermotolerans]